MKTIIKEFKVYSFEELNEKAKIKAIEDYRENSIDDYFIGPEYDDYYLEDLEENGFIVKRKAWDEMDPVTEDGQDKYKEHVVVLEESIDNTYDEDLTGKLLFKKLVEYLAEEVYYFSYDKWGKHNLDINFSFNISYQFSNLKCQSHSFDTQYSQFTFFQRVQISHKEPHCQPIFGR
jgi:hypothetical protein